MGKLRIILKWLSVASLCFASGLFLLAYALRKPADPALYPATQNLVAISVVDHGYHAGLVLPRDRMLKVVNEAGLTKTLSALQIFDRFESIEIGWGEKVFYQNVPSADIFVVPYVLRAMFSPFNASVLHVVGLTNSARVAFPGSQIVELSISEEGLTRIARHIEETLLDSSPVGPGLYGPSAFFDANGRYSVFNTCNHWIGLALARAGIPYAPVESFLSKGLLFDLARRARVL